MAHIVIVVAPSKREPAWAELCLPPSQDPRKPPLQVKSCEKTLTHCLARVTPLRVQEAWGRLGFGLHEESGGHAAAPAQKNLALRPLNGHNGIIARECQRVIRNLSDRAGARRRRYAALCVEA